jgi:hypothetical protein
MKIKGSMILYWSHFNSLLLRRKEIVIANLSKQIEICPQL